GGSFKCTFNTADGAPSKVSQVGVTITRGGDGVQASSTQNVQIANVAPGITISSPVANAVVTRGSTVTFTGAFTDPGGANDATYTCTINWGDGTASTVRTYAATGTCTATHVYTVTSTLITVTMADKDGGSTVVTRAIRVL